MQKLLNWANRASTVPNRSSNEFSGKNGALPAQTMTIPVGCLQRARLITVETRTLRVSSRLTTVFDSIPGDPR